MDHETTLDSNMGSGLELTSESKNYLQETSKWAKFIAILYFVFLGLFAIALLFAGSMMATLIPGSELGGANGAMASIGMFIYFLLIGAFIFFPALFLYRFSTHTKKALASENTADLTVGLKNMKSYWKFMGILMLVLTVLYGLAFVMIIIGGGLASMM